MSLRWRVIPQALESVYTFARNISDEMTVSTVFVPQLMPWAEARLVAGDPVKNARAILRYALPIQNTSARRIQVRRTQEFLSTDESQLTLLQSIDYSGFCQS